MSTAEQIHAWIDEYATAIRARDPQAVARCYADNAEIHVHGLGEAGGAWNSKHSVGNAGIEDEYRRFFDLVDDFTVEYTDRIVSPEQSAAAMVVRIAGVNHDGSSFDRANALHVTYDAQGRIATMMNWYGDA